MASPVLSDRSLAPAYPLVDGEWVRTPSGGSVDHVDPATGLVNGTAGVAGAQEADAAIAAAQSASASWRELSGDKRRKLLQNVEAMLDEHGDELARITSRELGHPLAVSRAHALVCAAWFGYYAGWADKIEGATIPLTPASEHRALTTRSRGALRESLGAIITWNGPLVVDGHEGGAGACGRQLRSSSRLRTSRRLGRRRFAELALAAGVPPRECCTSFRAVLSPPSASCAPRRPGEEDLASPVGSSRRARSSAAAADLAKPVLTGTRRQVGERDLRRRRSQCRHRSRLWFVPRHGGPGVRVPQSHARPARDLL